MASLPVCSEDAFVLREGNFAKPAALLESLAEKPRLARVTPATRLEVRPAPALVSFGIAALDQLTGGLPRGCLTEISGPDASGRTSVLLAALAAATQRGEICALIDASDAFHPPSGAAAGIDLTRLLWVRCTPASPATAHGNSRLATRDADFGGGFFPSDQRLATSDRSPDNASSFTGHRSTAASARSRIAHAEEQQRRQMENPIEQALRAADLLLQSGGFGMIVLDLAGVPVKLARRIPLTTWFRFRRAIEPTSTILLTLTQQPCAHTCATLSLGLGGQNGTLVEGPSLVEGQSLVVSRWSLAKKPPLCSTSPSSSSPSAISSQLVLDHALHNLAARSSQLEAQSSLSHAHLLETMPIHVELLRSRLEHKPAQSVTSFSSRSAHHFARNEACLVSVDGVFPSNNLARTAPPASTGSTNAFRLHAHQLRAHG
jgi:hypothetical protein